MALGGGLDARIEAHENTEEVRDYGVWEGGKVAVGAGWGIAFGLASFSSIAVLAMEAFGGFGVVVGAFAFQRLGRNWS